MRFESTADETALDRLHELLAAFWESQPSVMPDDRIRLETVLSEVVGNVVAHGTRPDGTKPHVSVALAASDDEVWADVSDDGDAPPAHEHGLPDALEESGRGLWIAHEVADRLDHSRSDGGDNLWHVVIQRR